MNLRDDLITLLRDSSSEVFDTAYYLSCYRNEIPAGMEPIEHFITSGLDDGLKPNSRFDPLVQRLLTPDLDREGLIRKLIQSGSTQVSTPPISDLLPGIKVLDPFNPPRSLPDDALANIMAAKSFGSEKIIPFSAGGQRYILNVPPARVFYDRLRDDKPCSFVRITHGDWDCMYAYEYYRKEISKAAVGFGFNEAQLARLAMRNCKQGVYAENFYAEFLSDLNSHSHDKDLMRSVAFKGYPTSDERLFGWSADNNLHPSDIAKLKLFSDYFDPGETLYDATVWKRWVIAGDLAQLPALVRDRPVIFMGADRVATLNERWKLPWYLHISIPLDSYELRHSLIDICREKIDEANEIARRNNTKRPLFILQGSSFAYWFIVRLFKSNPDIFYWDFGQAIHPWFYDVKEIELNNWGRLYGPTIVHNNLLEDFYRQQGVVDPVIENLFGDKLFPEAEKHLKSLRVINEL